MSVHAISAALNYRGVKPSEKLVLLALANYANEDNQVWVSHRRLAEETELGRRTIVSCFAALEAVGAIRREARRRPNGSRTTDLVTLTLESGRAGLSKPQGANSARGVVQGLHGGGARIAHPEPSSDPSVDPSLVESPSQGAASATVDVVAREDVETAFGLWNELAHRVGLPVARTLSPERRKQIAARLASTDHLASGLAAWREALSAVERSAFCRGEGEKGWRMDLGSLCRSDLFTRLLEGRYEDRGSVDVERYTRLYLQGTGERPSAPARSPGRVRGPPTRRARPMRSAS